MRHSSSRIHSIKIVNNLLAIFSLIFGLTAVAVLYQTGFTCTHSFSDPVPEDHYSPIKNKEDVPFKKGFHSLIDLYKKKNGSLLPHDHPDHPWHWTREYEPDPIFGMSKDCKGAIYRDLYDYFHKQGYVVFESCSLKNNKQLMQSVQNYTKNIKGMDRTNTVNVRAVRELSIDPDTLHFIEYLHGGRRRTFPFQTLNFPKGSEQQLHSDVIHFDTKPRTLMAAAWVALEDMSDDNGPLVYVPESHFWGTWDFEELGLPAKTGLDWTLVEQLEGPLYPQEIKKLVEEAGLKFRIGNTMKCGQTLVWAAGVIHGGSKQNNYDLSRLSQVTHYWFEGSEYYWVPRLSDINNGKIFFRGEYMNEPKCSPAKNVSIPVSSCADNSIQRWMDDVIG